MRNGLGELRILGKIEPAIHGINVDAGHPQPFLAGRINLRQFGNSRHLPQQPQRIKPALLNRARRPRQLRRPAQLAFDFLDELADLCRCGLGLFVLNADQGCLVLTVVEEDLENPVG